MHSVMYTITDVAKVVCRVGEHQHRLAHWCSLCENFFAHTYKKGMRHPWLIWVGHLWLKWMGQLFMLLFFGKYALINTGLQGNTACFRSCIKTKTIKWWETEVTKFIIDLLINYYKSLQPNESKGEAFCRMLNTANFLSRTTLYAEHL